MKKEDFLQTWGYTTAEGTGQAKYDFRGNLIDDIESLFQQYKNEKLPNADAAFHHEAEIAAGLDGIVKWLKKED